MSRTISLRGVLRRKNFWENFFIGREITRGFCHLCRLGKLAIFIRGGVIYYNPFRPHSEPPRTIKTLYTLILISLYHVTRSTGLHTNPHKPVNSIILSFYYKGRKVSRTLPPLCVYQNSNSSRVGSFTCSQSSETIASRMSRISLPV